MGEILLIVAGAWIVSKIYKNRKEVYDENLDKPIDTSDDDEYVYIPDVELDSDFYSNNYREDFQSIIGIVKKKV